jgi:hypothetical protein
MEKEKGTWFISGIVVGILIGISITTGVGYSTWSRAVTEADRKTKKAAEEAERAADDAFFANIRENDANSNQQYAWKARDQASEAIRKAEAVLESTRDWELQVYGRHARESSPEMRKMAEHWLGGARDALMKLDTALKELRANWKAKRIERLSCDGSALP